MSIIRHEIRQISDENRGQPIISQAVVHGNVAYFAGITPNPIVGDVKSQTAQVLRRVDELLKLAGTDKSHLLSVQIWIADMRLFEDHNSVWNEWVDPANPPARACLTTDFGDLGCSLKLWWLQPCHEQYCGSKPACASIIVFSSAQAEILRCADAMSSWVLCHEYRRSKRRCVTVREMQSGADLKPPQAAVHLWAYGAPLVIEEKGL